MDTFIKVASEEYFDIVVVELCNLAINQLVKLLQLPSSTIKVFIVTMFAVYFQKIFKYFLEGFLERNNENWDFLKLQKGAFN